VGKGATRDTAGAQEGRGHCCIWAKGVANDSSSGASSQVEARENFSKRSIVMAIRGVLCSQWRRSRRPIARCNSAPFPLVTESALLPWKLTRLS
jgi:hypothetical protein